MHILLTGAAGFVGGHLLSELKQQGHFVRAVSRARNPLLEKADEIIIETLSPHSDFAAQLKHIDTIIHLADGFNAYEHLPRTAKSHEATERLQTTIAMAGATAQSKVCFVYLSTVKTMCGAYADELIHEGTVPRPQSLYGQLKLEAEQAIMEAAQRHGSRAVILRFPIVFGRGVGGNMEKLLALADSPLPLPFKGLDNRRSLISAESLIDAVMTIVEQQNVGEGVFLVHDDIISSDRLVRLLRNGLSRPERLFALPHALWPLAEKLPGYGLKLNRFTRSMVVDDKKFRSTFNWQPDKPLEMLLIEYASDSKFT